MSAIACSVRCFYVTWHEKCVICNNTCITGQWFKWKQISSTNWTTNQQICHFYYILLRNIANVYYSRMLLICMSLHISHNNTCTYHITSHTTYDPFQIHDVLLRDMTCRHYMKCARAQRSLMCLFGMLTRISSY